MTMGPLCDIVQAECWIRGLGDPPDTSRMLSNGIIDDGRPPVAQSWLRETSG